VTSKCPLLGGDECVPLADARERLNANERD
jgi:hypothetical protein